MLVAWYFIPRYSCEANLEPCFKTGSQQPCCESSNNRGWRYFIAVLGLFTLFMFVCRVFLFNLLESPKFLLSRNRQREAVGRIELAYYSVVYTNLPPEVVQKMAQYNGARTWLDEKTLNQLSGEESAMPGLSMAELSKRNLGKFSTQRMKALFHGWRLGTTTTLLWTIWAT
jgi:hypothetical protein